MHEHNYIFNLDELFDKSKLNSKYLFKNYNFMKTYLIKFLAIVFISKYYRSMIIVMYVCKLIYINKLSSKVVNTHFKLLTNDKWQILLLYMERLKPKCIFKGL